MELQTVFYVIAIIVMVLSLIVAAAVLAMVLTIRAKVIATYTSLQHKADLTGDILNQIVPVVSRLIPVIAVVRRLLWVRRLFRR